jgi:putative ABC transport system permease protein
MGVIWYKVWRDLAHNKVRTALAVLSIATGVFALGLVFGMHGLMDAHLAQEDEVGRPANLTFRGERLGQQTVEATLREPGVAYAELETVAIIRWRLPQEAEWQRGVLVARDNYDAQLISRVELLEGNWPSESKNPQSGFMFAVERQTSRHFDIPPGASIVVGSGHGEMALVGGVVRKSYVTPLLPGQPATFYSTPEMIARLTGVRDPNKLYVRLAPGQESIDDVQKQVEDRLERMGLSITGFTSVGVEDGIPADWMGDMLDAMFVVLAVSGVALLGLSAFLIINTMRAIIARQVWQIGVMKALGATFWRVVYVYLSTALVYGLLALPLAIPLAVIGANVLTNLLLEMINIITTVGFQISVAAVVVQVVMAVVVSLLAAAIPVIGGARISAHACLSTYGLDGRFGRGLLDRLVAHMRFLPRPMALSLRNVFRRKMRVALTLTTFVIVGVMFISVTSLRSSFYRSVEVMLKGFAYDVMIVSPRHYRVGQLIEVTESAPGVVRVEVWERVYADLSLATGPEHSRGTGEKEILIFGRPAGSEALRPSVVAGRDLLPGEGRAIVIDNRIAVEKGIGVGDEVTLVIAGRESTWTVVGLLAQTAAAGPDVTSFVPSDMLVQETGHADRGNMVIVISEAHDTAAREQLVADLGDVYAAQHIETIYLSSADELRQTLYASFDVQSYLFWTMGFLAAVVGSMGLVGTFSINVIERMREVGVMRAVGAVSWDVFGIFVGEGVCLGVLSWVLPCRSVIRGRAFSAIQLA